MKAYFLLVRSLHVDGIFATRIMYTAASPYPHSGGLFTRLLGFYRVIDRCFCVTNLEIFSNTEVNEHVEPK